MEIILKNLLSFPVAIFTVLLLITLLYWLVAALGILDIDTIDTDITHDPGGDAGSDSDIGGLTALLAKLKLDGVPLIVSMTFISLFGWLIAYFSGLFLLPPTTSTAIRYLLGTPIFVGSLCLAILLTIRAIIPLKPLFNKHNSQKSVASLMGKTVVIRSAQVTDLRGEATYEDGGAGLLLQVRTPDQCSTLKRGETAVIIKYHQDAHYYTVISTDEFNGQHSD